MRITEKEKRFLVIWTLVNSFALFVNIFKIRGVVQTGSQRSIRLWTTNDCGNDFYPFTSFFETYPDEYFPGSTIGGSIKYIHHSSYTTFHGVFNEYGIEEFIFYSILGLAIVFLPKIFNKQGIL